MVTQTSDNHLSSLKLEKDGEVIMDEKMNAMSDIYYATNTDNSIRMTKTNIFSRNFD